MTAYNNDWLTNLDIQEQATTAKENGYITANESASIHARYTVGFYTPNVFIRIALLALTVIIVIFSLGLLVLITADISNHVIAWLTVFFGLGCYAVLEYYAKTKHHFRSGVDDALLWMSAICIISGIGFSVDPGPVTYCVLALLLAIVGMVRFTDRAMAAVAVLSLLGVVFFSVTTTGTTGKLLAPILLMVISGIIYFVTRTMKQQQSYKLYSDCLLVIETVSLFTLYFSGNYFVVNELGNHLFDAPSGTLSRLPVGWFWWLCTIAIPIVYLIAGIKTRNIVLIRVALLLFTCVVLTIRQYYFILPVEIAMSIGGAVLIVVSYWLINYLKEPRHGFIFKEMPSSAVNVLEALAVAQAFGQKPVSESNTKFGGGSFGGGGSSSDF